MSAALQLALFDAPPAPEARPACVAAPPIEVPRPAADEPLDRAPDPRVDDATAAAGHGGSSLCDDLQRMLEEACVRAEEELQKFRAIHARILGCTVDELDARLAAEEAERKAEQAKWAAARPERSPKLKRSKDAPPRAEEEPLREPTAMLTERQRVLLQNVVCEGALARFGSGERIPDWKKLKAVLEALGGVWTRKPQAFVFPDGTDVAAIVETAIATGEILDPKAAGYFPTPRGLAERVVTAARIRPGDVWLEPSAGQGAIADVAWERHPDAHPKLVELLDANRAVLEAKPYGFGLAVARDFLSLRPDDLGHVDVVIANPPFARGADVAHVTHAVSLLKPGGRLSAIMSAGVEFRDDAKTTAFRALVYAHGGRIERLPDGSFLESGTGVCTVLATLTKMA